MGAGVDAVLAFRGNEALGHLSMRHISAAKNYDRRVASAVNDSFLMLLQRAYKLRYLDNLPKDFNIVIANREFIAELDYTAITIQDSFRMPRNGEDARFSYHTDWLNKSPILFVNNYILANLEKQAFISAEPQGVNEVRNCKLRGFLEVSYVCTARQSDGQFLREGFKANDANGMQYQVSLPPIHKAEHTG